MCGDCFESRVQPEDVPRVLAAIGRVRTVLETEAVVGRSALDYRGLITAALLADEKPKRLSLTTVCACSHVNNWHVRTDRDDTHCAATGCPCEAFKAPSQGELPKPCTCGPDEACGDPCVQKSLCPYACSEGHTYSGSCLLRAYGPGGPEEPHEHKHEYQTGGIFKCACGAISVPRTSEEMSALRQAERAHKQLMADIQNLSAVEEMESEPPLTPEEEEQAPEDGPLNLGPDGVDCVHAACPRDPEDCEHGCRHAADALAREAHEDSHEGLHDELPPPEGPEYTPCVCGHTQPEHEPNHGELCMVKGCECAGYRTTPDFELPPRPDRRPPYAVSYSVQGHLFEVALPGDASVRAIDGALVIQHHLGPVLGIVQVLPVINEERA